MDPQAGPPLQEDPPREPRKCVEVPHGEMDGAREEYGNRAVFLHVYDLDSITQYANVFSMGLFKTGFFHVGIEVFGEEWYYRQTNDQEESTDDDLTSGNSSSLVQPSTSAT